MRELPKPIQTIYLSGPMGFMSDSETNPWNTLSFHEAASRLRRCGYFVISPGDTNGGINLEISRPTYLRVDFHSILCVDALVILPGWEDSEGAKMEIALAQNLDLPVYEWPSLIPLKDEVVLKVEEYHE